MSLVDVEPGELRPVDKQSKVNKPWQFQPGQSGNPGGRHRLTINVRDLARQYTEESIIGLAEIARDKSQPGATRAYCFSELLNRGHGKAPQKYEVEVSIFDSLSPEQRMYLDAILQRVIDEQAQAPVIDVTPRP